MDQFPVGRWRRRHKLIDITIEVIGSSIDQQPPKPYMGTWVHVTNYQRSIKMYQ